jgi:hypothetical protein
MRALPLVLVVALLAGAACGSAGGTSVRGGLYGTVTKGPLQPVCRQGVPCDGPAAGLTLVFRRNGAVAARATTGKDGTYRVSLAPGRYSVGAVPPALQPPEPQAASVPRRGFRRVDLFVDTGIR